jgi:hypothetical protein
LEQEFNRLEEAKRERELREKELIRQTNEAYALEQEALRIQAEAAQQAAASRRRELTPQTNLGPAVQADGIESSASAMSEQPEGWGTPLLRNLFGRSAETNRQNAAHPVVSP